MQTTGALRGAAYTGVGVVWFPSFQQLFIVQSQRLGPLCLRVSPKGCEVAALSSDLR